MSHTVFLDERRRPRGGAQWLGFMFVAIALFAGSLWFIYSQFRIDVPSKKMAILIRKTGLDIANGDEVAPTDKHKGVQREVLTEGRYFYYPLDWDWKVINQIEIESDKLGIRVSLTGDDLPYGEFLAKLDENGDPTTKGIMAKVLKPGRYPINPYLFRVEINHTPVVIPAGYKGVVTNLAGPLPEQSNTLLVKAGERGVQEKTLDPGTYYINPYVTRISQVDCRSQRFNLAKDKDMGFPSRDGFWISLDGRIEFRVNPEKAAEVFVTYNDETNGDQIDEEIVRKIIMPNARSFCRLEGSNSSGREFISGDTRTAFQENFQTDMQTACEPLGIEIIQALIADIKPPQQIALPVREKELAKQQEKEYKQQIEEEKEQQKQAVEQALVLQKQALVKAEQEVVKVTIQAEQEQEVAVTKAEERKGVAQFKLDAASDEAEAILSRGKAEAEVVKFQNEAEASGWKRAVEAFSGNGQQYAQFVLYQKMSAAYQEMMVNTADSPIMKIFESFTSEGPIRPVSETPKAAETSSPNSAKPVSSTSP